MLENMYVLFKVPPFHKNIACAIQKELHFREDCLGEEGKLFQMGSKSGLHPNGYQK